jgi:DUF4097 and DUF4098 domain-containing protein YvlB
VRTETFATPGSVRLKVSIPSGDIRLETSDEPETHVELEARDEEALAAATIEVRERGGGHEVVVEAPKKFRLLGFGNGEYRLYIRAPHGANVNMSTSSADIEAQGQYGTVELNSASGDAKFEEIGGEARVNTASGDLRLSRVAGDATVNSASGDIELGSLAGKGKIRSASGDVEIAEAKSNLSVQTASGDQEVGSIESGEISLQSASGDIQVAVASGATLWIDAKSMSGDTTSDLELEGEAPAEGGAAVELRAASMSGDIHVRRA